MKVHDIKCRFVFSTRGLSAPRWMPYLLRLAKMHDEMRRFERELEEALRAPETTKRRAP